MSKSEERVARLQRVKALGRIAYRIISESSDIEGVVTWDGEEKHLRNFDEDGIHIELVQPFRAAALPTEYSSPIVRHQNSKILEIRWDKAGQFKVVRYEPGDWERALRDYPAPIPFY